MSSSQTSDQCPVSAENLIDASIVVNTQETSFGESITSLLENQENLVNNSYSVHDTFHYMAAEDVQSHFCYEQDPFLRIEALYNQLTYSLGQQQPTSTTTTICKDYEHQRQLSAPLRSNSMSTVATIISFAAGIGSTNSQEKKLVQMPPSLMSDCQYSQPPLHHIESYHLGADKSNFLNPILVNGGTSSYVNSQTSASNVVHNAGDNFCPNFSYATNFATIASSPLFAKNLVLNSNTETLSDKRQIVQKGEIYDEVSNAQLAGGNVFPYYSRSNSSKLDELRESLNLYPFYVLPSSQVAFEQDHNESVISNSSVSFAAIGPLRRNYTENTPTPSRVREYRSTIPSSPIAEAASEGNWSSSRQFDDHYQVESSSADLAAETYEDTLPVRYSHVPSYNIHNMVSPIIFTFVERKKDFIHYVEQFISNCKDVKTSSRPSTYTKRTTRCHSPTSSEIYDIGPKILPTPFSKEFVALKTTKFKPLTELKSLAHYQLPKNQSCNYVIDKLKKKGHHCPKRPASGGGLGPFRLQPPLTLGEAKNDRYYSRLNIYELSKILELDQYDISLTKFIEDVILEMFGNYCDFKLGLQTWIRDTDKEKRKSLIQQLYSYSSIFYPEIDQFKLEVIIRRGSYSMMQTRLRRERRLKNAKR
ncbi:hypothetical protein CANMA_000052 [Candida margitis]|uniref:uncharacterized protein n=1 Tax=Candida margitis TaxID=1775924 RepID=UPI0022275F00|nr:uncharacterized protein CANMA_000052 [Candida margitis]KAI5970892.1 hypothetical protein CANMA_000052 [Candida margitis]